MTLLERIKLFPGFVAGLILGSTGTYISKPQTVTVLPPVDTTENGMRCTSFGDQLPDGGFVELCRPTVDVGSALPKNETPADPQGLVVVSFVTDGKGRITHRCEQASTGGDVCVPVDADGGR